MKICKDNELLINRYIDGDLTEHEAQALEAHMEECPACRGYCQELSSISFGVADIEYPANLHDYIMEGVDGFSQQNKIVFFKRPAFIRAVAAVVVLAIVSVVGLKGVAPMIERKSLSKDQGEYDMLDGADAVPPNQQSLAMMAPDELAEGGTEKQDNEADGEQTPIKIQDSMLSWFKDNSENLTVIDQKNGLSGLDDSPVPGSENPEATLLTNVAALSERLDGQFEEYGFYIVAYGFIEDLPDIFADQATDLSPGDTLFINVKNSLSVREQVNCSMTESGFEVYDDVDGTYFKISDDEAAEGIVIIELFEE